VTALTPADGRALAGIQAELARLVRYDDESIAHDKWVRQRYDCGCYATLSPARKAAVRTAWHEAGHAVAALATGARFSSASIHHGHRGEGRVHRICGESDLSFVVDAGGQIAERLMNWTMLEADTDLSEFFASWRRDGGDARRFHRSAKARFGAEEIAAWRYSEELLTPLRPQIRQLARALLVHPTHLRYNVAAALTAS
jgi:Peptidase M50B-like